MNLLRHSARTVGASLLPLLSLPSLSLRSLSSLSLPSLSHVPLALAGRTQSAFNGLIGRRGRSAAASVAARERDEKLWRRTRPGRGLRVDVADNPHKLAQARCLVRRRYAWRGYEFETNDAALQTSAGAHDREITFIAVHDEATIATMTLGLDGPEGLRADETHGAAIRSARSPGRRLCELTKLALAERLDSRSVLSSLFGLAYTTGRTIHGVTDLFIEVNPRHVAFYSRVFGFNVAASAKICERVRAPSVLLHVEMDRLAERLDAVGPNSSRRRAVACAA